MLFWLYLQGERVGLFIYHCLFQDLVLSTELGKLRRTEQESKENPFNKNKMIWQDWELHECKHAMHKSIRLHTGNVWLDVRFTLTIMFKRTRLNNRVQGSLWPSQQQLNGLIIKLKRCICHSLLSALFEQETWSTIWVKQETLHTLQAVSWHRNTHLRGRGTYAKGF